MRAACQGRGPTLPSPADGSPRRGTWRRLGGASLLPTGTHGRGHGRGRRAAEEQGAGRAGAEGLDRASAEPGGAVASGSSAVCEPTGASVVCVAPPPIPDPGKGEQCSERPLRGSNGGTGHRAGSLRGAEGSVQPPPQAALRSWDHEPHAGALFPRRCRGQCPSRGRQAHQDRSDPRQDVSSVKQASSDKESPPKARNSPGRSDHHRGAGSPRSTPSGPGPRPRLAPWGQPHRAAHHRGQRNRAEAGRRQYLARGPPAAESAQSRLCALTPVLRAVGPRDTPR